MSDSAFFGAPRRASGLLERPELVARLDGPMITTITAGTGYGKTTLLATWASASEHTGVWIDGTAAQGDRTSFWRNVFGVIAEAADRPGAGPLRSAAIPPGTALTDATITSAVTTFARSLDAPLVLVVDDAHAVDMDAVAHDLVRFCRFAAGSRLLVANRRRRFRPTTLASDIEESRVGASDLLLTPEETARLVSADGTPARGRLSAEEVHAMTGGIVGLARRVASQRDAHRGPEAGELLEPWAAGVPWPRANGLEENAGPLESHPHPAHLIAVLGDATAHEAAEVAGIPSDEAVAALVAASDHGLGWWVDGEYPRFEFAPVAAASARTALTRSLSAEQRRRVAARLAGVVALRGEPIAAFGLALDAQDFDLAVAIGKRSFLDLVRDDTPGLLRRMKRIPLTRLRRQPLLVLLIAILHAQSPRGRAAALVHFGLAEQLARVAGRSGAADDRAVMAGVRSAALRMVGAFDRAVPPAREFLDRFDGLSPEEQDRLSSLSRHLLWQAAHTLFFAGDTDGAVAAAQRMLAVPVDGDGGEDRGVRPALTLVAAVQAVSGSMIDARSTLEEASRHARRPNDFYQVWERTAEAISAIEEADLARARSLIDALDHDVSAGEYWPIDALVRALAEVEEGRVDGAIRVLDAVVGAESPPRQAHATRDVVIVVHALLSLAGRPSGTAADVLRHVSSPGPFSLLAEAAIALRAGRPVAALSLVGRGSGDRATSPRVRAASLLVRAAASAMMSQEDAARRAAREAVVVMSASGLATPWLILTRGERSAVLALVAPEGPDPHVVASADRMPAIFVDGARVERLTARERDVLAQLLSGATVPQVAEASGVSPNTVKTQRARIYRKLGVDNRSDAARVALEQDLL